MSVMNKIIVPLPYKVTLRKVNRNERLQEISFGHTDFL